MALLQTQSHIKLIEVATTITLYPCIGVGLDIAELIWIVAMILHLLVLSSADGRLLPECSKILNYKTHIHEAHLQSTRKLSARSSRNP